MPVSTDGVMLGAWHQSTPSGRALDIGTGTGLLTLMLAQRYPELRITAMDIDENAINAALHNFTNSPWSNRITLLQKDVLAYQPDKPFHSIICNPPYFNSGEKADSQSRATARHTDTLNHQNLLDHCQSLLEEKGHASFILPVSEGEAFIEYAQRSGWHLSRCCRVQPTENKPVSRLLIELTRYSCNTEHTSLLIRQGDSYSNAFIELTKAFYLKM